MIYQRRHIEAKGLHQVGILPGVEDRIQRGRARITHECACGRWIALLLDAVAEPVAEVRGVVDTQGFLQFRVTRPVATDAEARRGIATFLVTVLEPVGFRGLEIGAEGRFQVRVLVQVEGGIQNRQ